MPAPTYVTHTGPAAGPTSIAGLNYPASPNVPVAGDCMILVVSYEGTASNVASVSGWGSKVRADTGGGVFQDIWIKHAAGGESGSVGTITITGATTAQAYLFMVRSSTGVVTVESSSFGVDSTSGTAYSATTGSLTTSADDLLTYFLTLNNTSTRSSRTLTQSGATLGTLTARFGSGTNITSEAGDRPVTTGATAAVVNTYTLGTASTGLTAVVVLSEGAPPAQNADATLTATATASSAVLTDRNAVVSSSAVAAVDVVGTSTKQAGAALTSSTTITPIPQSVRLSGSALTAATSVAADTALQKPASTTVTVGASLTATADAFAPPDEADAAWSATATVAAQVEAARDTALTVSVGAAITAVATAARAASSSVSVAAAVATETNTYSRITPRPNLGVTPRPIGTTTQPNAGITPRP